MNDTMGKFKYRNSECDKEFVNSSNRSKHEKKTKHYVPGPRAASRYEPRWDENNFDIKAYLCMQDTLSI